MLPVVCDRLDFESGLTRRKGRWGVDYGEVDAMRADDGFDGSMLRLS